MARKVIQINTPNSAPNTKTAYLEYKLIAATDLASFDEAMNTALRDGWKPHGQVVVTPSKDFTGYGMQYTQAVIKRPVNSDVSARPTNHIESETHD